MQTRENILKILNGIEFRKWTLRLTGSATLCIQWEWIGPCSRTGIPGLQKSRKWRLSMHMTDSELVQTALLAAIQACEHEVREDFLFRDQPIFRPHYDIYRLHQICEEGAVSRREEKRHEINQNFDTLLTDPAPGSMQQHGDEERAHRERERRQRNDGSYQRCDTPDTRSS